VSQKIQEIGIKNMKKGADIDFFLSLSSLLCFLQCSSFERMGGTVVEA
jgi:hypothetical protein